MLVGKEEADSLFDWLTKMPFVNNEVWTYHNVVKAQMLRHKQRESPQGWSDLHGRLAAYYIALRDEIGIEGSNKYFNKTWQDYNVEILYHCLCQEPQKQLNTALNEFLSAFQNNNTYAQRWAETIGQAGNDLDNEVLKQWGTLLTTGLKKAADDLEDTEAQDFNINLFTKLLVEIDLGPKERSIAFANRARLFALKEDYRSSLKDITDAIELNPHRAKYWGLRGEMHRLLEQYKEALADYKHSLSTRQKGAKSNEVNAFGWTILIA